MQDGDKTELSAKSPLGVFGKGLEGVIDSCKQNVESDLSVGKYDGVQIMGQSSKIFNRAIFPISATAD